MYHRTVGGTASGRGRSPAIGSQTAALAPPYDDPDPSLMTRSPLEHIQQKIIKLGEFGGGGGGGGGSIEEIAELIFVNEGTKCHIGHNTYYNTSLCLL